MRRREFIGGLGATLAAWPVVGQAQHSERMRRIGLLSAQTASDAADLVVTFEKTLQESGWTNGRNVQIDYRWSAGNADNIRKTWQSCLRSRQT
jgi:putative ABC transport system substrate-binding protein